jgi:hypothetical protein
LTTDGIRGKRWNKLRKPDTQFFGLDTFNFILLMDDPSAQLMMLAGNWDGESFDIISQRLVSSTNLTVSSATAKSLIIIKNNSGPSFVPCGTPPFKNFHSEKN